MKQIKKIIATSIISSFILMFNVNKVIAQNDVGYFWVVLNFDFSCKGEKYDSRRHQAYFKFNWHGVGRGDSVDCFRGNNKDGTPLRGFYIKLDTDKKHPISEFQINTQNCTKIKTTEIEPDEVHSKEYVRVTGG